MSKFHNEPVAVELSIEEIWTVLKLFRDGELTILPPELEQRFIMGYHLASIKHHKTKTAQTFEENPIDIEQALEVANSSPLPEGAINAAWLDYLEQISASQTVKYYEPIDYPRFVSMLEIYVEHADQEETPLLLVSGEILKLNTNDWESQNFNQGLEELQEIKAEIEGAELEIPQAFRVDAIDLSIKAITEISQALERDTIRSDGTLSFEELPADAFKDPPPTELILLDQDAKTAFRAVKNAFQELHKAYQDEFKTVQEKHDIDNATLGETLAEGKLQAIVNVMEIIDDIEEKFKMA